MISFAIVEDDKEVAGQLQEYLARAEKDFGEQFSVSVYGDGLSFLDAFRSQFDIILMDIELPNINGMDCVKRVRETDEEVVVVFVTYMAQFAVKGYEVSAFDFIVKPVSYFPFSQKMRQAVRRTQARRESSVLVKTQDGIERISAAKIRYVEVSGHTVVIHMTDRELSLRCTMNEMQEKLKKYHFLRCNVCYLVNPVYIDRIADNQVIIGEDSLAISRPKKKEFLSGLTEYFNSTRGQ